MRAVVEGKRSFVFDGDIKSFFVSPSAVQLQDPSTEDWTYYYWDDIRSVHIHCDDYHWTFSGSRGV